MSISPGDDLYHELSAQREQERQAARDRIDQGDPAWHHEMGIMAAVEAARDFRFPLTSEELTAQAGDRYVQATRALTLPVAEILSHMPEQHFASLRDFERAVQKHWQAIRYLEVPEDQRSPRGGGRLPRR